MYIFQTNNQVILTYPSKKINNKKKNNTFINYPITTKVSKIESYGH